METPCEPQCLPPVSHLRPITAGAALLTVSSGPGGAFRALGQTCRHLTPPPKPSGESCPLEGELVGFVAEPEPCDFRGFPPCAVQGVKPWGGRTPAAKDPGTRQ